MNEWEDTDGVFKELKEILREGTICSALTVADATAMLENMERLLERNSWRFDAEQLAVIRLRLLTVRYAIKGKDILQWKYFIE